MDFGLGLDIDIDLSFGGGFGFGGFGGSRSFVSRYFALMLDQANTAKCAGFVKTVEGGAIKADVTKQEGGSTPFKTKGIGLPTYDPFSAQIGLSMSQDLYDWIAASWQGNVKRMNGAFLAMDQNKKVRYEQWFLNALVTETQFPAFDAGAKEPGYMTIKFAPEKSGHSMVPKTSALPPNYTSNQKQWAPSHFRFTLGDLPCKKVNKIDSFTIKQTVKRVEVGGRRDYELEPAGIEFPNLSINFSLVDAEKWFRWHEDFVINGNNDADCELEGGITLLAHNRRDELMHINLARVGIFNIQVDKGDASVDTIKRAKAEVYVEEMGMEYKGASFGFSFSLDLGISF